MLNQLQPEHPQVKNIFDFFDIKYSSILDIKISKSKLKTKFKFFYSNFLFYFPTTVRPEFH